MLNSALALVARIAVGRQLLAGVAAVNNKLSGHRSEILIAIVVLCHVLEKVGIVPDGAADSVSAALAPALPVTLLEKVSKAVKLLDKVAPDAPAV